MRSIILAAVVALTPALAPRAHAQGAPATPAAANPKLAGTWEGNYTTDGPSGVMTVTLSKEASGSWKLANAMTGDVPAAGEVRELATDGDKVSWKQTIGEYEVTFKATFNGATSQITGTLEAMQGATYVGGGSFTLSRKP
jgi:hypothetical protein